MPRLVAVRRTEGPLKLADSKSTMAVSPTISELAPPMTPATQIGLFTSQMQSMLVFSSRAVPSSVWMLSPSNT